MPKNKTLHDNLVKRYGEKKAEEVYAGMAAEGTGPFGPKGKYREEHRAYAKRAGGPELEGRGRKPKGRKSAKPRAGGSHATRGKSLKRRRRR